MQHERSWMYKRNLPERQGLTDEFMSGLKDFLNFASSNVEFMDGNQIRCPCRKCHNGRFLPSSKVSEHLCRFGFTANYYNWTCHGEPFISDEDYYGHNTQVSRDQSYYNQLNPYQRMIFDVAGSNLIPQPQDATSSCPPTVEQMFTNASPLEEVQVTGIDENMSHAKSTGKKPACVTSENWSKISNFWQTYESKKRSQQNKINQACNSGDLSATYARGSINIKEHSRRLSKELGKEPEFIDTFVRTFQKKDKTWSGDRARAIKERYDQLSLSQRISGDDGDNEGSEPSVSNNLDLWLEASGGAKGGRILGMGSMSRTHNLPRRSLSSTPPAVTAQIHNLTEEVSNLKGIIFERDQQIAEIQQQRDQQIAEIQQQNSQRDQEMIEMRRQQAFLMQQFQQFSSGPSWIPPGTGDDGGDDDDID